MYDFLLSRIETLAFEKGQLQERLSEVENEFAEYKNTVSNKTTTELLNDAVSLLMIALKHSKDTITQIKMIQELVGGGVDFKTAKEAVEKGQQEDW